MASARRNQANPPRKLRNVRKRGMCCPRNRTGARASGPPKRRRQRRHRSRFSISTSATARGQRQDCGVRKRSMRRHHFLIPIALLLFQSIAFADSIAPTGTLRAAYLSSNPAQAVRDPATGEIRGASADLAREFAKRRNIPVVLMPLPNPATVIEAVAKNDVDIGFVAYAPERVGTVEFSQIYMLVQQSFVVPENSRIRSVGDIDVQGLRIAGSKGDCVPAEL